MDYGFAIFAINRMVALVRAGRRPAYRAEFLGGAGFGHVLTERPFGLLIKIDYVLVRG